MKAKKSLLLTCLMVTATFCLLNPAWGTSLSFKPVNTTVDVADTFDVEILLEGLAEDTDLGVFELTILFDPAILAFHSYSLGTGLGALDQDALDDTNLDEIAQGSIALVETSLLWDLSSQANDLLLATVRFSALSAGTSALSFDALYYLGDALGDSIEADFSNGTVTVNPTQTAPVPEPATGLLFGMGIAGLAALQRRRRQQYS